MGGRIPQSFIDELLNRVDIVDVVGIRVPLKKAGRDFTACCPFHNEKTPSFSVSQRKQFYHCFGCGAHGNAIGFLMEHDRMEFPEAVEDLAESAGLEVPREAGYVRTPVQSGALDVLAKADRFYQEQLKTHRQCRVARDYLDRRGLSDEVLSEFGIGFAPDSWDALVRHLRPQGISEDLLVGAGLVTRSDRGSVYDRFRGRVMFPIRNRRGKTIGFGGRLLGDGSPKYLNSPETDVFHKGRELYGLHEAEQRSNRLARLLVVEGYMDVISLSQFGVGYAVATLGTATTREHMDALYRRASQVIFCFDGDRAGRDAARRALENALPVMRDGREARFLFLPDGEDPDSLVRREGSEAFAARIDSAVPLSDFLISQARTDLDLATPDGRAALVERARPHLDRVPGGAFWELMVGYLAELTKLSHERVRALLHEPVSKSTERPNQKMISRTPVRHAVALIVNYPELATEIEDPVRLAQVQQPGIELLRELIEFARSNPHMTTGTILERYRGTQHEAVLARLALWKPALPESLLGKELDDTVRRLYGRQHRQQLLLDKVAKNESLSNEEWQYLRECSRNAAVHKND